jgi:hypothetical protein
VYRTYACEDNNVWKMEEERGVLKSIGTQKGKGQNSKPQWIGKNTMGEKQTKNADCMQKKLAFANASRWEWKEERKWGPWNCSLSTDIWTPDFDFNKLKSNPCEFPR